jgi:hypothetical protein
MFDEMLLARIETRHIHFLAQRGALPSDLPEASPLQKTDTIHGALLGVVVGGTCGVVAGVMFVLFPPGPTLQLVTILITALLGALFGAWVSSMVGLAVPNSRLKRFRGDIERGSILMMTDVPMGRAADITARVIARHPEIEAKGFEPEIPAFP